jgi:hypothetical protein
LLKPAYSSEKAIAHFKDMLERNKWLRDLGCELIMDDCVSYKGPSPEGHKFKGATVLFGDYNLEHLHIWDDHVSVTTRGHKDDLYSGTDLSAAEKVFVEEVKKVEGELCLAVCKRERPDVEWTIGRTEKSWCDDTIVGNDDYPAYQLHNHAIYAQGFCDTFGRTILDFLKVFGEAHPIQRRRKNCSFDKPCDMPDYECATCSQFKKHPEFTIGKPSNGQISITDCPSDPNIIYINLEDIPALISELEKVKGEK